MISTNLLLAAHAQATGTAIGGAARTISLPSDAPPAEPDVRGKVMITSLAPQAPQAGSASKDLVVPLAPQAPQAERVAKDVYLSPVPPPPAPPANEVSAPPIAGVRVDRAAILDRISRIRFTRFSDVAPKPVDLSNEDAPPPPKTEPQPKPAPHPKDDPAFPKGDPEVDWKKYGMGSGGYDGLIVFPVPDGKGGYVMKPAGEITEEDWKRIQEDEAKKKAEAEAKKTPEQREREKAKEEKEKANEERRLRDEAKKEKERLEKERKEKAEERDRERARKEHNERELKKAGLDPENLPGTVPPEVKKKLEEQKKRLEALIAEIADLDKRISEEGKKAREHDKKAKEHDAKAKEHDTKASEERRKNPPATKPEKPSPEGQALIDQGYPGTFVELEDGSVVVIVEIEGRKKALTLKRDPTTGRFEPVGEPRDVTKPEAPTPPSTPPSESNVDYEGTPITPTEPLPPDGTLPPVGSESHAKATDAWGDELISFKDEQRWVVLKRVGDELFEAELDKDGKAAAWKKSERYRIGKDGQTIERVTPEGTTPMQTTRIDTTVLASYDGQALAITTKDGELGYSYETDGVEHFVTTRIEGGVRVQEERDFAGDHEIARRTVVGEGDAATLVEETGRFEDGALAEGTVTIVREDAPPVVVRGTFEDGQVDATVVAGARKERVITEARDDGAIERRHLVDDGKTLVQVEEVEHDGRLIGRTQTTYDPATKIRKTEVTTTFDADGEVASRKTRVFDANGAPIAYLEHDAEGRAVKLELAEVKDGAEVSARIFERSSTDPAAWDVQVNLEGGGRAHNVTPLATGKDGLPDAKGPGAYAVYDENGALLGFEIAPGSLLGMDPAQRAIEVAKLGEQLVRGLTRYQSDTIRLGGFHGANDIHEAKDAFAGFVIRMLEKAEARGGTVSLFMSREDGRIYAKIVKDGAVVERYAGEFGAGKVEGERGAIGVYTVSADGHVGTGRTLIYSPTREYLEGSITEESGSLVTGLEQERTTFFVERKREAPVGPFTEGRRIEGGKEIVFESPNLLSVVGSSVWAGGQSIVALVASAIADNIADMVEVQEVTNRAIEDAILAGVEALDPEAAAAARRSVEERRAFVDASVADLRKRSEANLRLNPIVVGLIDLGNYVTGGALAEHGLSGSPSEGARLREASEHYIFNAPRELLEEAMRTSGVEKGVLIGAAVAGQVSLDFLTGLVVLGPVLGAVSSVPRAALAIQRAMQAALYLGAADAAFGDNGVVDRMVKLGRDPSAENELLLYESIARFASLVAPAMIGFGGPRAAPRGAPRSVFGGTGGLPPSGRAGPVRVTDINKHYRLREHANGPAIVEIRPEYDHNGAFYPRVASWRDWVPLLPKRLAPTPLRLDIQRSQIHGRPHLKDFVVFQDHGWNRGFGKSSTKQAAEMVAGVIARTGKRMVIIDSCSQGDPGFGLFGRTNAARFKDALDAALARRGITDEVTVFAARRPGTVWASGNGVKTKRWTGGEELVQFVPTPLQTPYPYIDPTVAAILAGTAAAGVAPIVIVEIAKRRQAAPKPRPIETVPRDGR